MEENLKNELNKILMNNENVEVKIVTGERKEGHKEDYAGLIYDRIILIQNFSNIKKVIEEIRTIFEKYKLDENLATLNKDEYEVCPNIEHIKNNLYYGLDKAVEKISKFLDFVKSFEFHSIEPELHDKVRDDLSYLTHIFGWFKYEYNMFLELLNRFEEEYKNFNEKEKN